MTVESVVSVVLHFYVAGDGELRCRATDIYSRRTWMVHSARAIHDLLRNGERDTEEVNHAQ